MNSPLCEGGSKSVCTVGVLCRFMLVPCAMCCCGHDAGMYAACVDGASGSAIKAGLRRHSRAPCVREAKARGCAPW